MNGHYECLHRTESLREVDVARTRTLLWLSRRVVYLNAMVEVEWRERGEPPSKA